MSYNNSVFCCRIARRRRIPRLASTSRPCSFAPSTCLRLGQNQLLPLYAGLSYTWCTTQRYRVSQFILLISHMKHLNIPMEFMDVFYAIWTIVLTLLPHPEKVQAEIDRVVGQSRQPTLADRPNMPYADAVIHEIQRMGNIIPLGFPKMASKDTTLGGYFIPKVKNYLPDLLGGECPTIKFINDYLLILDNISWLFFQGTAITAILSSVLFDKDEWATPDIFNPEHFLDSEGNFRRRDAFLPFSAGFFPPLSITLFGLQELQLT